MAHPGAPVWRLILSDALPGADNMALDEALMQSVSRPGSAPVLRLYSWDPACVSLGYAQPFAAVDPAAIRTFGWDLVRRPTGGRAILHRDELTYAVVGPSGEDPFAGGVLSSYRLLSAALICALEHLGLEPRIQPRPQQSDPEPPDPVCFQIPSAYEITVRGKKLIGSAQLRRAGAILQHGSLPLGGDIGGICQVLRYPNGRQREQAAQRLADSAATVEAQLGRPVSWSQAAEAFRAGFEQGLGVQFKLDQPTSYEQQRWHELRAERYANESWTTRS